MNQKQKAQLVNKWVDWLSAIYFWVIGILLATRFVWGILQLLGGDK